MLYLERCMKPYIVIGTVAEGVLDMKKMRVDVESKTCRAREGNNPPLRKVCDEKR